MQFSSLPIVPHWLVRIRRIAHRLLCLEHPSGNCAEVEHHGVALGRLEEIDRYRIDQREVPRSFSIRRAFQFRHTEPWVRHPRNVANIVSLKVMQGLERVVVNLGSTQQRQIHHHLEGWRGLRNPSDFVPMDVRLGSFVLGFVGFVLLGA